MKQGNDKSQPSAEDTLRALLKEAEDFKYAIEESSIVAIADAAGAIRYSNHNFRKISHFEAKELEGRTGHIVQEEFYTQDFVRTIWASVAEGNIWRGELKFRAKDGSFYWADTSIVPFIKDDAAYQYVVIKKDITARKLVEEQLRTTHETLLLHVENTPLGFIEWDTQLNVRAISKRAEEIFGWNKDDLAENGAIAYAKLFEEVLPWISKLAEQLMSGEASGNKMLHRNLTKDGRTISCEWFNSVVKDTDGKIVTIVSLVLDLTEKLETEAQLRESEAFNRGVLNSLSSNVAVVDADGEIIAVNASWQHFATKNGEAPLKPFGVGSNYFTVCANSAKQGDKLSAKALRGMKDILNGKETDLYLEYPCHSPTEKRWFGMRVMLFETDEPLIVVAHNDITERKLSEEQLLVQNQERELRAAELVIANTELAFQIQEKAARAAELAIANEELIYQNKEKEARANELIVTNMELKQAQFERDNSLLVLEKRVVERTEQLAAKNKDITDSINYAKRIQASLLSPFSQLALLFNKSFILHEARDIVSGDFYWCVEKGDRKYVVVADCTGHGVPGALMSIIGNNLLNEVVINDNIQNPSDILQQLDIRLKEKMKGDHGEVVDGMDLVLCVVDTCFKELYFVGALRPLFLSHLDGNLTEIHGSRHCIGGAINEADKHFVTHRMSYEEGQRIYLTSDGYHSQFGGPEGKKFMKSRFKSTLAVVQHLSMEEQCLQLKQILSDWQGQEEQVDDVLVVGIEL